MSGIGPFKLIDLLLILMVAISGLVAMYRGFTREVLSILSWAVAAVAAFYVVLYQPTWADELARQGIERTQQGVLSRGKAGRRETGHVGDQR